MPTIKGGFHINNRKMDKESAEKFRKATKQDGTVKERLEKMGIHIKTKDEIGEEKVPENADLYKQFEEETGKNAIWAGKETKAYKQWLSEQE